MKSKFEAWFEQQYFYNQLKYIHGDRLFDFDDGVGYRNLTVQVGYVAFCGRDAECVLGGAQTSENQPESIVVDRADGVARTIRVKCTKCGHYLTGCYCYSDVRHDSK